MLDVQFQECMKSYHEPLTFMTHVDAMIQGIRNYTFAVQANKKAIPNFDDWYSKWQERLKNDEYMNWLNSTRVNVVHDDILTTLSTAKLTLLTDHTHSIITEHYDVMTSTAELIENARELAKEHLELTHATGTIKRKYFFDVSSEQADALSILAAGLSFMRLIHNDLHSYMAQGEVVAGKLPQTKDIFKSLPHDFDIIFKLKDGSVLTEKIVKIDKEKLLEGRELAKKRYGRIRLKHSLGSVDKLEVARAHFEIAKKLFVKDGHHVAIMFLMSPSGVNVVTPVFADRAEKIRFMRSLANCVKDEKIEEIIYTTESWAYPDLKKGLKHINAGKEISSLRKKGEALTVHYVNRHGEVIVLSAPIARSEGGAVKLGKVSESVGRHESLPIFFPVYAA